MSHQNYEGVGVDLPPSHLHDAPGITEFLNIQLEDEGRRVIQRQYLGILACQDTFNVERALRDVREASERSAHVPPQVFVVDDSWDNEIAAQIQTSAESYGVEYHRVRNSQGIGNAVIDKYCQNLTDALSPSQRLRNRWLARSILKNDMDTPLAEPREGELEIRGGCEGARNFGYLAAIYEAGRDGFSLDDVIVTINDDDNRCFTIAGDTTEGIQKEWHDFFSERQAWFSDPITSVVAGRYAGHRGNPIAAVQDALEICRRVVSDKTTGALNNYTVLNVAEDAFDVVDSSQAFDILPEIIDSILMRHPIIGLVTRDDYHKQPVLDWQHAKINGGSVTLLGSMAAKLPIPTSGLSDYNFGSLLRSEALNTGHPNRALRVEQATMHQRRVKEHGGNAGGSDVLGIFANSEGILQTKLMHVIRGDAGLQKQIISRLNVSEEYFDQLLSDNQDNASRVQMIQQCLHDITSLSEALPDAEIPSKVSGALQLLATAFSQKVFDTAIHSLQDIEPDPNEVIAIKRGILRYLDAYTIWPQLSRAAYDLGRLSSRDVAPVRATD